MASTSEIRNRLIDRLMAIRNSDYLKALEKMIDSSNIQEASIALTEEQKIAVVHSLDKSHVIIEQSNNNCHTLDYWKTDEENNLFKLKTETITKPRWKSWLGL